MTDNIYITEKEIEEVLDKALTLFLIPRFQELGMNATGEWIDSLNTTSSVNKGVIRGRDYTEQLVKGRKGGTMPPVSNLIAWVGAKWGLRGREAERAAWAVAQKIKNEGTTWYQKGGSNLLEVFEEPRVVEFITEQIGSVIKYNATEQLKRNIEKVFKNV